METHRWEDLKRKKIPAERLAEIKREAREEILRMNLQELRQRRDKTQEELAALMGAKQSHLSRAERREDHMVSTLKAYVEALGGRLEVRAVFDDGQAIELIGV